MEGQDVIFQSGPFVVRRWGVGECEEFAVCGVRPNGFVFLCKKEDKAQAIGIAFSLHNLRKEKRRILALI